MIQPQKIIRSKRKTLSISIDSHGRLVVRAPRVYPEERIFAFLKEKEDWIVRNQKAREKNLSLLPKENLDAYVFPLLGKSTKICLYDGGRVALNEKSSTLFLPRTDAEKRLKTWLKRYAKEVLESVVRKRAEEMGLTYSSLSITSARTRWGSCSGENALHFSFRLVYAPREVVDYVAVHELAHIPHRNHGEKFWALVERYVPEYKKMRRWLKDNGYLMQIF